ncbi:MAG TPA: hypothetical protein VE862_03835 [Candidatus Acidoferrum sp.]|nr:hypothetical protein [Candidatus Acidoferrum sp.]
MTLIIFRYDPEPDESEVDKIYADDEDDDEDNEDDDEDDEEW